MKKRLPAFLAGMLTTALLFGFGVTALAASGAVGTVEFNTVGLIQNGVQVFFAGEDYLLENGYQAPTSVLFTDPSGNGTTYLPVRRVAELFDAEISWDSATGSVTLGKATDALPAVVPSATPTPAPSAEAEPQAATVYVTKSGGKYHRSGCRYLSKSQISITLTSAKNQGYAPCSVCKP